MKTLKHALLVLMMLASLSNIKAQCIWAAYASPNGANVQFTAYIDSNNLSGSTYYWDFGDGDTSQYLYPVHTYTQSGPYNYCFHYSGPICTTDTCGTVVVDVCDFNPQMIYSFNQLTATFGVSNSQAGDTYNWIIYTSGGNQVNSALASPVVTFPTWGVYTAHLTVTRTGGCVDTATNYIYLNNPCAAHFYYGMVDSTTAQFYPTPFDSVNTPSQFTYAWTFGDGGTSSQYVPNHDFGNYGTYNVCVTVTGSNCTDTYCQQISVSQPPPPTYNIYGTINKGASYACASTVYLIQEDSAGHLSLLNNTYTIDSGGLNCNGNYSFYNIPQGVYYVKAALDSADADYINYLPTYYGDVLNWGSATALTLNSYQYNIDINLIAGVNPGGPGFVGGWVSQGAGLTAGGSNIGRAIGDPLPNIQINLLTANDVPVASAYTDANGRYTFNNLAIGTYKVYAEEINKVPYSLNVILTANNPSQDNVNVSVNSNSAVTGIDDLRDIHVEGISPNPIADKTTVSISLNQNSKVQMSLTDVNGRLLQNKYLDLNAGTNSINLDLNNEAVGVYHLSLTNGSSKRILKLVKVK